MRRRPPPPSPSSEGHTPRSQGARSASYRSLRSAGGKSSGSGRGGDGAADPSEKPPRRQPSVRERVRSVPKLQVIDLEWSVKSQSQALTSPPTTTAQASPSQPGGSAPAPGNDRPASPATLHAPDPLPQAAGSGSVGQLPSDAMALHQWYGEFIASGRLSDLHGSMQQTFGAPTRASPSPPGAAELGMSCESFSSQRGSAPMPVAVDLFSKIQDLQAQLRRQEQLTHRMEEANAALLRHGQDMGALLKARMAQEQSMLQSDELAVRGAITWARSSTFALIQRLRHDLEPQTPAMAHLSPADVPTPEGTLRPRRHSSGSSNPNIGCFSPKLLRGHDDLLTKALQTVTASAPGQDSSSALAALEAERATFQTELSRLETEREQLETELVRERWARQLEVAAQPSAGDAQDLRNTLIEERVRARQVAQRNAELEREVATLRAETAQLREEARMREQPPEQNGLQSPQGAELPWWVLRRSQSATHRTHHISPRRSPRVHPSGQPPVRSTSASGTDAEGRSSPAREQAPRCGGPRSQPRRSPRAGTTPRSHSASRARQSTSTWRSSMSGPRQSSTTHPSLRGSRSQVVVG